MKKIYSILAVTLLLILATGCEDWLDVRPDSEIVLEDYWQNESQVNQVMAACYRSLTEPKVMNRMLVWGELRSDNVTFGYDMPADMEKILNVDISPKNPFCHWGAFYTTINYCNNFLHYAPEVVGVDANFTESKLRAMEAEVITIRALAYFYLVRTFKEVPWIDEPSIDDTQDFKIPKSPEAFVLNNIIEDLKWALLYAREKYDVEKHKKGRITRNGIRALLADIYLWTNEYAKSVEMCDQILNDTEQELALVEGENVLSEVFYSGNSTESIFELQYDEDIQFNDVLKDLYGGSGIVNGQWSFPYVLVRGEASPFGYKIAGNEESDEDIRLFDFLRFNGERYYVFKYAGALRQENEESGYSFYFYRSTSANWIVYRLPEIMLMKAEALIQLEQDLPEAVELINMVYMRSNPDSEISELKPENYNSKLELEKLLLRERQRELMFEGKRWFDLMRLARREESTAPLLNYVMKKISGSANSQLSKMSVMDALYLPIHIDEMKANTALEQNPFYELLSDGYNK